LLTVSSSDNGREDLKSLVSQRLDIVIPEWRDDVMSVLSHKGYYKMKMIAKWSRIACLRHYGLVCACCGYADTYKKITQSGRSRFFLEFDHIAGGGSKHFRERKGKTLTM